MELFRKASTALFVCAALLFGSTVYGADDLKDQVLGDITNASRAINSGSAGNVQTSLPVYIGRGISLAISFIGVYFLVRIIFAGALWATAQGNAEQIDKAKKILTNAVIGLAIVLAAGIIVFIASGIIR